MYSADTVTSENGSDNINDKLYPIVALYRFICTCTLRTYIYTLYGIQDPGPCIHVTVYTDPYPVPHETTNTVYH